MILVPPHSVHTPPARVCVVKVHETEWVQVHHKWVRVVVVKDERGTWHDGRCVPDPVRHTPEPKPTHIPELKPAPTRTLKPIGHPTGHPTVKPTGTGKPTVHPTITLHPAA